MKTNPNEPINPNNDWGNKPTYGLTKREHMAIEFTKAYANSDYVANSGMPYEIIAKWGIEMADALIAQLNKEL